MLPSAQFHSTNTFPLSYVDVWAPGDQVPCAGVGEEIFLGTGSSPGMILQAPCSSEITNIYERSCC